MCHMLVGDVDITVIDRKLVAMVTSFCPLHMTVFTDSKNPISEPNPALISRPELNLAPFLYDFRSFLPNLVPWKHLPISCYQKCPGRIG